MDDDRRAALLGDDPAAASGYLLACAVVAPLVWAVLEWHLAWYVAEALPEAFETLAVLALVGTILVGTAAAVAHHAAANRGYVTGAAGALVVLYAAAFGLGPINVGPGFTPEMTVYEQAGRSLAIAGTVAAVVATAGTLAGLAARRAGRPPTGWALATVGAVAARPVPGGPSRRLVVVALLVVLSAATWAGAAPAVGGYAPCASAPSYPEVEAARGDGTLALEYDHACGIPARSLVVERGDQLLTWAALDPALDSSGTITRGRTVTVALPPEGRVLLLYERGGDERTVLGYWNASAPA